MDILRVRHKDGREEFIAIHDRRRHVHTVRPKIEWAIGAGKLEEMMAELGCYFVRIHEAGYSPEPHTCPEPIPYGSML